MTSKNQLDTLVSILSKLAKPAGPEGAMITVVTGNPESFAPDLFQVINNFDGTYQVQQLEGSVDEDGCDVHTVIAETVVGEKDISSIAKMCPEPISMNLTWGPQQLITA